VSDASSKHVNQLFQRIGLRRFDARRKNDLLFPYVRFQLHGLVPSLLSDKRISHYTARREMNQWILRAYSSFVLEIYRLLPFNTGHE
jgi:hypothetical protein